MFEVGEGAGEEMFEAGEGAGDTSPLVGIIIDGRDEGLNLLSSPSPLPPVSVLATLNNGFLGVITPSTVEDG